MTILVFLFKTFICLYSVSLPESRMIGIKLFLGATNLLLFYIYFPSLQGNQKDTYFCILFRLETVAEY